MVEHGNNAVMRDALEFAEDELWALGAFDSSRRVAAALSTPPRNCDRFEPHTTDEVKAIIDEWRASARVAERNSFYAFARWLFAKATKKGDNDGSK